MQDDDDLPDWLDRELWADFERHRVEKRAKLTPTARSRLLSKLRKWGEEQGPDYAHRAIRASLENGWQGVFAPKAGKAVQPARPPRVQEADY